MAWITLIASAQAIAEKRFIFKHYALNSLEKHSLGKFNAKIALKCCLNIRCLFESLVY